MKDAVQEANTFQRFGGAPSPVSNALIYEREFHLLKGRKARQQVVRLENKTESAAPQPGAGILGELRDIVVSEDIAATTGTVKQADNVHHSRLARARLPHDRDKFPLANLEIDTGQGIHRRLPN
jgi:hypothetical protein